MRVEASMKRSSTFWGLSSALRWLFVRLPWAFSIPFTLLLLAWTLHGFKHAYALTLAALDSVLGAPMRSQGFAAFLNTAEQSYVYLVTFKELGRAVIVVVLFLVGVFVVYNVAALINWLAVRWQLKRKCYEAGPPQQPPQNPKRAAAGDNPLARVERIGIVLAGGGAKGAFQAGAMKAIYRFLAENDALHKVKVIASTSIGSWNALFWLGDLIAPEPSAATTGAGHANGNGAQTVDTRRALRNGRFWTRQGLHERWWRSISAKSLVAPYFYLPFFRNAFLSSMPWRQAFDHLFGREDVKKRIHESKIHFYMTRTNVRTGELECATNNKKPAHVNRIKYDLLSDCANADEFLDRIRTAVFASMDLPPLFPYTRCDDDLFEDGGVIDNLPLSFAAREGCDLVFVLPLNADFEEEPNEKSIFARLNRVLDMRQGALERQGFKLLYLYNELAALRHECEALRGTAPARAASLSAAATTATLQPTTEAQDVLMTKLGPLDRALVRRHEPLRVFAVCPQKAFVQDTIDTRDLWNSTGAETAFRAMYKATTRLLASFDFKSALHAVRVALVSRGGKIIWDDDF
jgi:predicted acylesterase/phospholipase RssA